MKLVSFSAGDGKLRPGALVEEGNVVVDLGADYTDTLAVVTAGITDVDHRGSRPTYRIGDVRLHAPITNPPRLFAIGLNYRDHAKESGMEIPDDAGGLLQAVDGDHRAGRSDCPAEELRRARLRGRVRVCHRQGRLSDSGIGMARARLRLHDRERRERARCAVRYYAVVAEQEFPHLLPDGPGDRDSR